MQQLGAADILTQGAATAGLAKVLVDLIRLSPIPSPSILLPIIALACSEMVAVLLLLANGGEFNKQNVALVILVGLAAAAGAVGITEVQKSVNANK